MIKALFDKVNGLKKEEVSAKWKDLMDVAEAEDLGGPTPDDSDPEKDEVGKKKKEMLPKTFPKKRKNLKKGKGIFAQNVSQKKGKTQNRFARKE